MPPLVSGSNRQLVQSGKRRPNRLRRFLTFFGSTIPFSNAWAYYRVIILKSGFGLEKSRHSRLIYAVLAHLLFT